MRDATRMLAEARATKFQPPAGMPTLTPAAPTATIGNVQSGTRPANKGVKRFMVGPGGDWGDMANPMWWAKGLAQEANKQIVQPIAQMPSAFDPTADLSAAERINRAGTGALTLLDVASPFIPEGTAINSVKKEAMERMLDRQAASYAESPLSTVHHRTVLGVHGSPVSGLSQIEPQMGSVNNPQESVAWFWDAATGGYDPADLMNRARAYAGEPGEGGQIYVARFPRRSVIDPSEMRQNPVTYPNQSYAPGRVVGSVNVKPDMFEDIGQPSPIITLLRPDAYSTLTDDLRNQMVAVMTPAERRAMASAAQLPTAVSASNLAHEARLLRARYEELARHTGDF